MKATKKIIEKFYIIDKQLLKTYAEFKSRPSARNLSALAIQWGIFATTNEMFPNITTISINKFTEIFITIQDYSKDILIY